MVINFEEMMSNEFGIKPNHYIVQTKGGTVLKVDEEWSIGQVIVFVNSQILIRGTDNPYMNYSSVNAHGEMVEVQAYQGFVEKIEPVKHTWDRTTDPNDIYEALVGNPMPISLIALLVHKVLQM